jgi:hypothetical protein
MYKVSGQNTRRKETTWSTLMWVGGNINADLNMGWVSQLVSFGSGWIWDTFL